MLSASFDSDTDKLLIYQGNLQPTDLDTARKVLLPWMLSSPVPVNRANPIDHKVLDFKKHRDGSKVGCIRPGLHIEPFTEPKLNRDQVRRQTEPQARNHLRQPPSRPSPLRPRDTEGSALSHNVPPLRSSLSRQQKLKGNIPSRPAPTDRRFA